jgi:predicted RNase H-like nuclease (RuvC/YqgF family)
MGAAQSGLGTPQNEQKRQSKRSSQSMTFDRMSVAQQEKLLTQLKMEVKNIKQLNSKLNRANQIRDGKLRQQIDKLQKEMNQSEIKRKGRKRILNDQETHLTDLGNKFGILSRRRANLINQ